MWSRQQYENFSVVSLLLPRRFRQDFYNIYAYCRWSDNLADEVEDREFSLRLLTWWQGQLSLCFSGRPAHPILVALQDTINKYALPIAPFTDLLSAFRQDQEVHRYADQPTLLDYCRRSANPVGRILLMISEADTDDNRRLSDEVCTGLQLANFCQDLSRDAALGRIYVPKSLWTRHGVSEAELLSRDVTDGLRSMLAEWVSNARGYLHRGWPLVARVPRWLATDVDLFVRGGLSILDGIEASGFDVWTQRPVVSRSRKLRLLGHSLWQRCLGYPKNDQQLGRSSLLSADYDPAVTPNLEAIHPNHRLPRAEAASQASDANGAREAVEGKEHGKNGGLENKREPENTGEPGDKGKTGKSGGPIS